jgi:hypothetical protein
MSDHVAPSEPPAPSELPGPPAHDRPEPGGAPVTGHPTIDASLQALAQAADAAPVEQLPAYQAAHRTLRETLASIDESAGAGAPGVAQRGASQPQR